LCQIRNERAERYKKDPTKAKNEKGELVVPLLDDSSKLVVEQKGEDYILSPILMPNGEHFDSRDGFQNKEWDGDANGAYNVARKGLILLYKIRKNPNNPELFITNREWDEAVSDWDAYCKKSLKSLILNL